MSRFTAHVAAILFFWLSFSFAVSLLLTRMFGTPVFLGFLFVGLGGGAWSSYQTYRKYYGRE